MLGLIYARTPSGLIGYQGALPWHIPEELQLFRKYTADSTLIMGRKTWASLPGILPRRHHVVITRTSGVPHPDVTYCSISAFNALAPMIQQWEQTTPVWIIGGARLLTEALLSGSVDCIVETEILQYDESTIDPQQAVYFNPGLAQDRRWSCVLTQPHLHTTPYPFIERHYLPTLSRPT
ncbi:MAG: dihydrofolate reductase [Methylococcaceae bacterium]